MTIPYELAVWPLSKRADIFRLIFLRLARATTWMDPASATFGRVTVGRPTRLTITLFNPTGTDQTFSISTTKFTPSTFGGTVPSIWNAGTFSAGDPAITVPASVNGTG